MVGNGSILVPKSSENFYCELCDYSTCRKSQYDRHLSTDKHKNRENDSKMVGNDSDLVAKSSKCYECECGNKYKYDSGYYRHKKKCNKYLNQENNMSEAEVALKYQEKLEEIKPMIYAQLLQEKAAK